MMLRCNLGIGEMKVMVDYLERGMPENLLQAEDINHRLLRPRSLLL